MSYFCKFGIDGYPENKIGHPILVRDGQKAIEKKFNFQGSQILHIRVAISLVDVEIGFEKICLKMGKTLTRNATRSESIYEVFLLTFSVLQT